MGTTWRASFVVTDTGHLTAIRERIERELALVIDQMSTWEPGSCISRFNSAPAGSWHSLPSEFFTVLSAAFDLARRTGGAYDPTIGELAGLWGFGPEPATAGQPDAAALSSALTSSGWQRLDIEPKTGCARQAGGVRLDLSSIAKGFAVDQIARVLPQLEVTDFLAEVGGELLGEGMKPDGTPWWVQLEDPPHCALEHPHAESVVALHGLAIATSGDYRRFRDIDGRRLAHTIDPRTGSPVTHDLAAVSVIAESCMQADAIATALMVFGPDAGAAYADENGISARFAIRGPAGLRFAFSRAMSAMLS